MAIRTPRALIALSRFSASSKSRMRVVSVTSTHKELGSSPVASRAALISVTIILSTLMQTLDSTITNVALPNIQGNLGASQDEGTWIVTAYTIAAIVVIPLTPWLQNRFGRRNYFLASIIGFTIASIFCE